MKTFYQATCPHLPPTTTHPEPSPFSAYLHAYALVCTRAFLIDLYLTVALCPFADLFNHSSLTPHSSLQSDDFVCHLCGSLAPCSHDIMSTSGVVRRLEHLPGAERTRLEREVDSVEMRVERELGRGEEVMNCYGEGMGDGRLLVEWGFVGEEFAGEGLGWNVEQLGGDEGVKEVWSKVVERELIASAIIREAGQEDGPQHETGEGGVDRLIRPPAKGSSGSMNLNQSGEISINLFGYLYLSALDMSELEVAEVEGQIVEAVREVETAWTRLRSEDSDDESGDHQLSPSTKRAGIAVINLLDSRLASMHRPRLSLDEIFEMRDVRPCPSCPGFDRN